MEKIKKRCEEMKISTVKKNEKEETEIKVIFKGKECCKSVDWISRYYPWCLCDYLVSKIKWPY